MAAQQAVNDHRPKYMSLLDQLAATHPFAGDQRSWHHLTEEPIKSNNPLELLLLAETAMQWRHWPSAALLFARMMIGTYAGPDKESDLIADANKIIVVMRKRPGGLKYRADLFLYGFRRLVAALKSDDIEQPHLDEWMRMAFSELARTSPAHRELIETAIDNTAPWNTEITTRYQADIGHARSILIRSLDRLSHHQAQERASQKARRLNLTMLLVAVAAISAGSIYLRDIFAFGRASTLFLDCNWLGALLLAWPCLLVATWFFALLESTRTCTIHFISPEHLTGHRFSIIGEVIPFNRDWFFHIFQFIWIPLLAIEVLLFAKYEKLPESLPRVWNAGRDDPGLSQFIDSLSAVFWPDPSSSGNIWHQMRLIFASDLIALLTAFAFAVVFAYFQVRIQKRRQHQAVNLYWWDRRISRPEWIVRLLMVALDVFLGMFLLLKIMAISLVASDLMTGDTLSIGYFAPDGVGGMKFLTEIFTYLSWLVFLFGLFVIASMFLHWRLVEYRVTDAFLVAVYIIALAITVTPLMKLEIRFEEQKDALLGMWQTHSRFGSLSDAAKYLKDVATFREWRVSAVKMGIFDNPVLPLMFQLLVIVGQYLIRAGKIPDVPIPTLTSGSAHKGSPDGS